MIITDMNVVETTTSQTAPAEKAVPQSIVEFERRILNHMRDATKPWFAISQELKDARKQLSTDMFKQLCEKVRLSYSTARKLIKVAESSRLQNYADRLACIDSWSTLHEIAKLDSSSFDAFAAEHLSSNEVQIFQRADVERFNKKKNGLMCSYAPYFTVKVSASAALSTSDACILAKAANALEQSLAGKVKLVWHVDKPSDSTVTATMMAA